MPENETPYAPPVDRLLTLGHPSDDAPEGPAEMGIGPEHIPELIRMATDPRLLEIRDDIPELWAPMYAWRTLGDLRAAEAVELLVDLLLAPEYQDDDLVLGEVPDVLGRIGAAAIPALQRALEPVAAHGIWGQAAAGEALEQIGTRHPEERDACVRILTRKLERFGENDREQNGYLISSLVALGAVEAAPLMERVFAAGRVDTFAAGDWDDVEVALGLREPPSEVPGPLGALRPSWEPLPSWLLSPGEYEAADGPAPSARRDAAKAKARRKQQRQARRKNRKRK